MPASRRTGRAPSAPASGGVSPAGPSDTPAEVEALRIARFRGMTPREKMRCVVEMNRAVEAMATAGLRARHGADLDGRELGLRLAALRLPAEVMREAFGWDPDEHGL